MVCVALNRTGLRVSQNLSLSHGIHDLSTKQRARPGDEDVRWQGNGFLSFNQPKSIRLHSQLGCKSWLTPSLPAWLPGFPSFQTVKSEDMRLGAPLPHAFREEALGCFGMGLRPPGRHV